MNRLKLARKTLGLSTRELALKVGVSAQAISKYERGLMAPSNSILSKLAKALNTTEGYLAGKNSLTGKLKCEIVHICPSKYIH